MTRANTLATSGPQQHEFTDADFNTLRGLVRTLTGITLSDAKRDMIYGRLARRLRSLGLDSFSEYCALLEAGDRRELTDFVNAVTTNLTSFFREAHHFDFLAGTALPQFASARSRERRLRIWSAGCSTGEEAYSIAIVLREAAARFGGWDVRVLATDIDTNVLATASAGVYASERVRDMSSTRSHRWFRRDRGGMEDRVVAVDELKQLIAFRHLNLMESWPFQGKFDAIFCRNVVIYFDKETQRKLFDRYADALREDGLLFVGHSETLSRLSTRFELVGRTIYRRV